VDTHRKNDAQSGDSDPSIDPLKAFRILRSAGGALFNQVSLHGQLARVEWAEEKRRLLKMFIAALLGFAFTLCVLLFIGVIVLTATWDTDYRVPSMLALTVAYAIGVGLAWHWLQSLSALSGQAFAATREEIAADVAMLKSRL
jgi:uncharacterized membrane protein YqjE